MQSQINAMQVVTTARKWLGTPYQHQASLAGIGCDCLGLIRGVWRELVGKEPQPMPDYASTWTQNGGGEDLLDAARENFVQIDQSAMQIGDVLIFRMRPRSPAKHAGIACPSNRFIHAYEGNSVVESPLDEFWRSRIAGVFRFPNVGQNCAQKEES